MNPKIPISDIETSLVLAEICPEECFQNDSELDDELLRDIAVFSSDEELDQVSELSYKQSEQITKTISIRKNFAVLKETSVVEGIEQEHMQKVSLTEIKLHKQKQIDPKSSLKGVAWFIGGYSFLALLAIFSSLIFKLNDYPGEPDKNLEPFQMVGA